MKKYKFKNTKLYMGLHYTDVEITARTKEEAMKRFDSLKLEGNYETEEPYDERVDFAKRMGKNDIVWNKPHYTIYPNSIRQSLPIRPSAKRGNR